MSDITVRHSGDDSTLDYLCYFLKGDSVISPFHDIPLVAGEGANGEKLFNMVVEIPRGTSAKMEISTGKAFNPVKQDVKNAKLRFVDDVTPYAGYVWNYGAFPQTWEDPTHKHPETGAFGDNDPLDVCEIGSADGFRGQIKVVKVLGVIALIDEGETDWKVIVIDVNDPLAAELNDIDDVHRVMPGYTFAIYEWLRTYKMPTGKPANEFAFHGEAKNKAYALQVIEENHQFWRRLITGEIPNKTERYTIATDNVSVEGSPYKLDAAPAIDFLPPSTNTAPKPAPASAAGVRGYVEQLQRASPHGNATLAAVIGSIADGVLSGNHDVSDPSGHFTIAHANSANAVSYGIYQPRTPHTLPFSLADQLGDKELVAAVFASHGGASFVFSTGVRGVHSFTKQNGEFVQTDGVAIPTPSDGSSDLLGEVAPLTFLNEKSQ